MKFNTLLILLLLMHVIPLNLCGQSEEDILFWWDFNDEKSLPDPSYGHSGGDRVTKEKINDTPYQITGLGKYVPGVKGTGFKLDGFSSYIEGVPVAEDGKPMKMPGRISVESWVALGAYPWNWAPILSIGKYKVTGFYFGVDSRGRPGLQLFNGKRWHTCKMKIDPEAQLGMKLRKWYHVAATFSPGDGIKLYLNGELVGTYDEFTSNYGITYTMLDKGFRIGMNREPLAPTDPVRSWATFPSQYSLDGIIDETKVYGKVLSEEEIKQKYEAVTPDHTPEFAERKFPEVKGYDAFTADYTRLEYYPGWDNIWPPGDYMDVVVQFEHSPVKVMFWRGSRYSPCWVSENGKWMADQSRETGYNWFLADGSRDNLVTGCVEHMSDAKTRSSRVSIIENTDARVTVNWRYRQMDVLYRHKEISNNTGFGEWGNELYYIYPDAVGVRFLEPGRGGWQETIFFNEPGTRPEDNIHLEAVTLMNLKGESETYSWEDGFPRFDLPNANIQIINFKSEYKPFLIFVEGGSFGVFSGEVRPEYSHFPWWTHWPVAQVYTDGRYAVAPDRAAHSSLSWGSPNAHYALYGMAKDKEKVLKIARAWTNPPQFNLKSDHFSTNGYNQSQRAYVLEAQGDDDLKFTLEGSAESPLYNPAFIVDGWSPEVLTVLANGQPVDREKYEYGVERDVNGHPSTIIWLNCDREEDVAFEIKVQ